MKKLIFLFILLFRLNNLSAQIGIEWQKTYGGTAIDFIRTVIPDVNGGSLLCGTSLSAKNGNKNVPSFGLYDYWLVQLDVFGNSVWQRHYGGSQVDELVTTIKTADGGYLLGGTSHSDSDGNKTEDHIGSHDYWIVKTDSLGNIQWQNDIGGRDNDYLRSIIQTSDGGYFIAGISNSDSTGDKITRSIGASFDIWVLKLDSAGNIQWQKQLGTYDDEEVANVLQTPAGEYIIGSSTGSQYWLIKLDAFGTQQLSKTFGGSNNEDLFSIAHTFDGGLILAGRSDSNLSGDKTENSYGQYDYWIVKLNILLDIEWDKTVGGSLRDNAFQISQTINGEYVVGGSSLSGISGNKTEANEGSDDFWVVKLDTTGNLLWQKNIGGLSSDGYNCSLKEIPGSQGQFFAGLTSNSNISGDKTEDSFGSYDFWTIKFREKYNRLQGNVFIDSNSNLVRDSGETFPVGRIITELTTGNSAFTQTTGNYAIAVFDSGTYTVNPPAISYYTPTPASHSVIFSGILQTDTSNNFAFQPAGIFDDLCITITPTGNFRGGMNAVYLLHYNNLGTTSISPTIIFFPDQNLSFVGSSPIATSAAADSVFWTLPALAPFQSGNIWVTVYVNNVVPINTLISSFARIEPLVGDVNPHCNFASWEVYTTGPVDPNDMLVDQDTIFTFDFPNPPDLNYIIRFQNVGNDTAFSVKVLNQVPANLDLSTFELIASSHSVGISYDNPSRLLEFNFNNISLPDSQVNESASHGFVRYKIKPLTTLIAGDSVSNSAAIYFDFNEPVLTNIANTYIVLNVGIQDFPVQNNSLLISPNPATTHLTIRTDKMEIENISLYNMLGSKISVSAVHSGPDNSKQTFNISKLPSGLYIVRVSCGEKILHSKFMKE